MPPSRGRRAPAMAWAPRVAHPHRARGATSHAAESGDGMTDEGEVEFELAIVCEPEGAELSDIEGVSDDLALHVVALTLARAAIEESVEVSLLVTGDEHIRTLSRDFRGKDEATDVLSFPLLVEPLVDAPDGELWQPEADDESIVALNGASIPVEPELAALEASDADADAVDNEE